jgi:hypothetical protein
VMPHHFTLVCASPSCGKRQPMEGGPITLGVHLMQAAKVAGWMVAVRGAQISIFCSEECIKKNTTKAGLPRRHPR